MSKELKYTLLAAIAWAVLVINGTSAHAQTMYCDGNGQCRNLGLEAQQSNERFQDRLFWQRQVDNLRAMQREEAVRSSRCGGYPTC